MADAAINNGNPMIKPELRSLFRNYLSCKWYNGNQIKIHNNGRSSNQTRVISLCTKKLPKGQHNKYRIEIL